MLIKERRTLWFRRHLAAQAAWILTAAWANGASNALGESRHETQKRALMSRVDLSSTRDEWERRWAYAEMEGVALAERCFIFFLNCMVNEEREILQWVKLDSHATYSLTAGSQYWVNLQINKEHTTCLHWLSHWAQKRWQKQWVKPVKLL